jgi:hypothetical protein
MDTESKSGTASEENLDPKETLIPPLTLKERGQLGLMDCGGT